MKKITAILLMALMVLSLTACGNQTGKDNNGSEGSTEPTSVTITTLNGQKEQTQLEVPYNPERIAILDLAALDIIDSIGVGDKVVGMAQTSIDYLSHYSENKSIKNLGTIKEADIEAVMECEPDIIFIGGRLSASYDKLSEIAPVVYLATDSSIGLVESTLKNATTYIKHEFYQPDEPDIITDEKGEAEVEFFCSDINTSFVGVIEGTDGLGNLGTSQCEFRVLKP